MVSVVALVVGYVIGARTDSKDFDQVVASFKAVCESDEFADLTTAVRSHVGSTLRGIASMVDGRGDTGVAARTADADLVDRVRYLFARD